MITLNEYNHSLELLSKLDTVMENASIKMELCTLTEAYGPRSEKYHTAKETFKAAWTTFLNKISELIDSVIEAIGTAIRGGEESRYGADLKVSPYAYNKYPDSFVISALKMGGSVSDEVLAQCQEKMVDMRGEEITLKKGDKSDLHNLYKNLKKYKNLVSELKGSYKNAEDQKAAILIKGFRTFIQDVLKDVKYILKNSVNPNKMNKIRGKDRDAQEKAVTNDYYSKSAKDSASVFKAAKGTEVYKAQNDSVDFDSIDRNEFIANLMLEAADLLKDDVVRDNSDFEEFEDVPEERPVEMDDYITSVNGGDDEDPDLDEIEDLCDGDKEVMALLTDDEDKSVTVDATNESALNFFDLDF